MASNNDFRKGYRCQERGQWGKAVEYYLRVPETSSEYDLAMSGAACCRAGDGNFKEAVRLCRQLIANTSPEELQARLWLQYDDENPYLIGAYTAVQLGERETAEKFLELFARHPRELVQRAMLAGSSSFWEAVRAAELAAPLPAAFPLAAPAAKAALAPGADPPDPRLVQMGKLRGELQSLQTLFKKLPE